MKIRNYLVLAALFALAACNVVSATTPAPAPSTLPATETPAPTFTPQPSPTLAPTPGSTPSVETPTLPPDPRGEEAISILQPGPGSRVTDPIHISGVANPTFEQHLAVSVVLDDGTLLTTVPTIINAESGQRGSFEVDVPVTISEERQGFIQVYDTSARDGGILHLASVGVTLAPSGPENIVAVEPQPERIAILQPAPNATVSGGVAHVEGFALASFEQTLLAQVLDAEGNVVGEQSAIVTAPDLGQPGPFSVDVAYNISGAGPGRIVVRDVSPAFGGDTHVASVEVNLSP
jgi:hypothetical protein